MRRFLLVSILLIIASFTGGRTLAASSGWVEAEGASLRLVTTGVADAEGQLRGALEIRLQPGWKTYWRDPGGSGVPPSIDVSTSRNIAAVAMEFPAPIRFDDGYAQSTGYDRSVALPLVFHLADKSEDPLIEANVFLGVCDKICVPVQARLDVDPMDDADNPGDAAAIGEAFAVLPKSADAAFGVASAQLAGDSLVVEATVPGGAEDAELFVAGDGGYSVGTPVLETADGRLRFTVPVFDQPNPAPGNLSLPYTLVAPAGAVSGSIVLP